LKLLAIASTFHHQTVDSQQPLNHAGGLVEEVIVGTAELRPELVLTKERGQFRVNVRVFALEGLP
jgi:hypothetical protein